MKTDYDFNWFHKKSNPQPIAQIIGGSDVLGVILKKARLFLRVNKYLQDTLPYHWGKRCQTVNLDQSILTVQVPNARLATRLRYETPKLLEKLRMISGCSDINRIKWKVNPELNANKQEYSR